MYDPSDKSQQLLSEEENTAFVSSPGLAYVPNMGLVLNPLLCVTWELFFCTRPIYRVTDYTGQGRIAVRWSLSTFSILFTMDNISLRSRVFSSVPQA